MFNYSPAQKLKKKAILNIVLTRVENIDYIWAHETKQEEN